MPMSVRLDPAGKPIAFGKVTDFRTHVHLWHMEDVLAKVEERAWTEMNRKAQDVREKPQVARILPFGTKQFGGGTMPNAVSLTAKVFGVTEEQLRDDIAEEGSDGYNGIRTQE